MADVYVDYDESGRKYFERAMFFNILLCIGGALMYVYWFTDIVVLITVGIIALGATITYLVYFLVANPPLEHQDEAF
jgi:hypothetical protein